jgi:CheY-like chemotaxis protein
MPSVLVVDDEDVLLEMIALLVESLGYRVVAATNGQEALEALRDEATAPMLVISDVMMPHMNGIALARAIRADPLLRDVPIILMSAAGRAPQDALADHFIHKPFDLERIEQLVEQYADTFDTKAQRHTNK